MVGLANLALSSYDSGMFSDRRLKTKIKLIGREKGFNLYSWVWNTVANKMGLDGGTIGCMAEEIYAKRPDCVHIKDLFMWVNYGKLGIIKGGA
jgi:hypothetical protein